jgi:16S rRNA (adenine1518-N6/adenine1519-N6)-dimethyltransferase
MYKVKPLKRFGQNYLKDPNIIRKIVDEIDPALQDNLVEIGPGQGSLTSEIVKRIGKLTAVEIDKRVTEYLSEKFPNLRLIDEDFIKFDLYRLYSEENKKLRIVGNIPYNLTSSIIFKMIEQGNIIEDSILMVQYEVAKRITAKKGTKDYGILAVLLQQFTKVKFCFKVSPNVFYPKPKVYSALVHLYFKETLLNKKERDFFIMIVKSAFGNRRKTLKNSLSNSIFKEVNFSDSGIDLSLRAEQLDINDFMILSNFVQKHFKQIEYTNQSKPD